MRSVHIQSATLAALIPKDGNINRSIKRNEVGAKAKTNNNVPPKVKLPLPILAITNAMKNCTTAFRINE